MITPTVGRVVWYYPNGVNGDSQPHAALIALVHDDRQINIAYFDAEGTARAATRVQLLQEGDTAPQRAYCCWMPYQKGQAAKTEAAERALADK